MKLAQRIVLEYYQRKFNILSIFAPRKAAEIALKLFCTPYTRNRKFNVPEIFTKAEQLNLNLDDLKIIGFRWIPSANSNHKKILICHGFDSFSYRFENYIQPLLDKGFEVLAFDAPAHGESGGKTITIIQYRNMILEINKTFGSIQGVLAHSFGGLAVALAIEQINDNSIKQLVLVAPATETVHAIDNFFNFLKLNHKVRTHFNILIEELGGNPSSWYSVSRVLQAEHIPTLWIHDKEDTITPYNQMHHLTEMNLPHIEFEITTGLGHSPYTDEQINKRIVSYFSEM